MRLVQSAVADDVAPVLGDHRRLIKCKIHGRFSCALIKWLESKVVRYALPVGFHVARRLIIDDFSNLVN